jgi:hypothetical protein
VCIESTTDDDCERLRDATDLIEQRERETMPCGCMCVWGGCYHHYSAREGEQEKSLSFPLSFSHFLSRDCLWFLDARAHVYNKQDSIYVSMICVWGEKKRKGTFSFSLSWLNVGVESKNGFCVRKRKKYLCNETTTINDWSVGNSVSSTVSMTLFY